MQNILKLLEIILMVAIATMGLSVIYPKVLKQSLFYGREHIAIIHVLGQLGVTRFSDQSAF